MNIPSLSAETETLAMQGRIRPLLVLLATREAGVFFALIMITIALSLASPVFLTPTNLLNVGRQVSLVGIMAIGMTLVTIAGEIDLSVGSLYALGGIITALLLVGGHGTFLSLLSAVAAGALCGVLNGVLSTYGRIPSFIVTLGTLNIARGLALIVSNGMPITLPSDLLAQNPSVRPIIFLAQGRVAGIPMQFILFALLAVLGGFLLSRTVLGFWIYAVGGSDRAARAAGLPVELVKLVVFTITGALAAFAGALNFAFLQSIQAAAGTGLELDVIAAVIIGGTRLAGGEGSILGTILGVLLMGILRNGLVLLGIPPFWQTLVTGAVIVSAVAIDKWIRK